MEYYTNPPKSGSKPSHKRRVKKRKSKQSEENDDVTLGIENFIGFLNELWAMHRKSIKRTRKTRRQGSTNPTTTPTTSTTTTTTSVTITATATTTESKKRKTKTSAATKKRKAKCVATTTITTTPRRKRKRKRKKNSTTFIRTKRYIAEAILGHKPDKGLYLVRWKGYTIGESTWEPKHHFDSNSHFLRLWHKFLQQTNTV